MRLIKPSVEVIKQSGKYDIYKHIASCYAFIHNIKVPETLNDCRKLVDTLELANDTNMLRHAAVYMILPLTEFYTNKYNDEDKCDIYEDIHDDKLYVTTTYDFIYENSYFNDLQYSTSQQVIHEKMITVKFVLDKLGRYALQQLGPFFAITHGNSFNFNYGKKISNNQISFLIPSYIDLESGCYIPTKINDKTVFRHTATGDVYKLCTDNLGVSDEMFKTFSTDEQLEHSRYIKETNVIHSFLTRRNENEQAIYKLIEDKQFTPQSYRNVMMYFGEERAIVTATHYAWTTFMNKRMDLLTGPNTKKLFTEIQRQL